MSTQGMEQVMNLPLNGLEVRKCILAKIEEVLSLDTRLAEYAAFPAFRFHADIGIVLQGAVHDTVERIVDGEGGKWSDAANVPSAHVVVHAEQLEMPPNEARVEAGIGVPVLTRDEKGREVTKEIKYAKGKKAGKNAVVSNAVPVVKV